MTVLAATQPLLRVLYSAVAASIGVTLACSLAVYGSTRASDMRRAHRARASAAFTALALAGLIAFAAAVVYGLVLVTQKS